MSRPLLEVQEPSSKYLTQETVLGHGFEFLVTAKGDVTKLRKMILSLAARGMLGTQCATDESADAFIICLDQTRHKKVNAACVKTKQASNNLLARLTGFVLPAGWSWASLNDLGSFAGGKTPSTGKSDYWSGSIPWITSKDMKKAFLTDSEDHVSEAAIGNGLAIVPKSAVLIVVRSGILRRMIPVAITTMPCTINQDLKALTLVEPAMAAYVQLMIAGFESFILENLTKIGTTVEGIKFDDFAACQFPIPPLAEQHRIVAGVEELMNLCDALEQNGRLADEQHARLTSTLFDALAASESAHALAKNWQRVAEHFDLLLDRSQTVDEFEQIILNLAIRGLLLPQEANDESAKSLHEKIQQERARLFASGIAKREKLALLVAHEDQAFPLPSNWTWVRFDEVVRADKPIAYGVLVPGPDASDGVPFVRLGDLSLDKPALLPEKSISPAVDAQFMRTRLEGGEILLGVVGSIGKLGVAPESWKGANIARAICRIVPTDLVDRRYVLILLQSKFMKTRFIGDTRTLAQPTLNIGLVRESPMPLPPLAEQHRIVARVNELRALCARLRDRLTAAREVQSRLADALVADAA